MMDAGMIAAPVGDASVPAWSVSAQGTSAATQGQGTGTTQNDGGQSSFADVLQQSSNASSNTPSNNSSSASSYDQSNRPSNMAPQDASSGSSVSVPPAKAADGTNATASLPVIGGQLPAGSGVAMVAAPVQLSAVPLVLQAQAAAKQGLKLPTSSVLNKSNEATPAKNDMRKPMMIDAQGKEAPLVATPAMVQQPPLDATALLSLSSSQSAIAPATSDTKGTPPAAGGLAATAKPAGTALKNVRDAAQRPAGGDATGATTAMSSAATMALDTAAASAEPHGDTTLQTAQHAAVAVDLIASAVGSTGLASPSIPPVTPAVHVQVQTSSAADSTSSLHTGASTADAAASSGMEHATLVATPNVLEVGLSSGTHGWLRVRAEMSNGGDVSASVKAASETAFDSLHKELPSMSAYLASERVGVTSLVVEHTPASSGFGSSGGDSNAATTDTGGQGTQAGHQGGAATGSSWNAGDLDAQESDVALGALSMPVTALPLAAYANASGGWLSVRA